MYNFRRQFPIQYFNLYFSKYSINSDNIQSTKAYKILKDFKL